MRTPRSATSQAGPSARRAAELCHGEGSYALEGNCPRERERERERRVSDADASYNGPASGTTTLNCAIPQSKHAKYNSFPVATRSLSQGPRQKPVGVDHEDRPLPDLMYTEAIRLPIDPSYTQGNPAVKRSSAPPCLLRTIGRSPPACPRSPKVRPAGIEPAACGLKDRCSLAPRREPLTTELRARAAHDGTTGPRAATTRRSARPQPRATHRSQG